MAEVEGPGAWQAAHAALVELARTRAGLDYDEGRWLLSARRSQAHAQLGYGSFTEYIERLFGYSPRFTHDKLRVAEALESLPELAESLRSGTASWSSVRELTRVATAETERIWLEQSRGRTTRDVEKLVSGHRPGSLPDEPAEPEVQRHCLRFEVSGEVLATFREALSKLHRDAGGHLDDDDALLLMARQVLGGPVDDGRASYQVELNVCPSCERALQLASGELVEISAEAAAMARCDSQPRRKRPRWRVATRSNSRAPTWAQTRAARGARPKTSRPPCAVPCCVETYIAAEYLAAATPISWICTTSSYARTAGRMTRRI
jgi:hypothetical protein